MFAAAWKYHLKRFLRHTSYTVYLILASLQQPYLVNSCFALLYVCNPLQRWTHPVLQVCSELEYTDPPWRQHRAATRDALGVEEGDCSERKCRYNSSTVLSQVQKKAHVTEEHNILHNSVDKKNQLDVTFCILYFSSNSCSTCFGQPCAHHQELTTAWCYSLVLVCAVAAGRWSSPVGR